MQTLLLFYVSLSLVQALIALPLMRDKIKPNPFYGFRVQQTLENPEVWYAVNRHFGNRLFVLALFQIAASVGLYFWPGISLDVYALSVLGVFVVVFGVAFSQSWRYMNALAKKG